VLISWTAACEGLSQLVQSRRSRKLGSDARRVGLRWEIDQVFRVVLIRMQVTSLASRANMNNRACGYPTGDDMW
jgi:hypothetical protein